MISDKDYQQRLQLLINQNQQIKAFRNTKLNASLNSHRQSTKSRHLKEKRKVNSSNKIPNETNQQTQPETDFKISIIRAKINQ